MPRGEIFLQLYVHYDDDPKVRALGRFGREARPARDLFVQMLNYCKANTTDGVVPVHQLGVLAYPDGQKLAEKQAQMLVEVGLAEPCEGGFYLPGYLKRNKSRKQVEASATEKARKGRESNHKRWHQEKVDRSCEFCVVGGASVTPSVDPSGDRSGDPSGAGNGPYPHRSEVIGHRSEVIGQAPTANVTPIGAPASPRTVELIEEHLTALDRRPSSDTVKDLQRKTDLAVAEGYSDQDIREGLALIRRNPRLGAGMLLRLIDQAIGERPKPRTDAERMFG